MKKNAKMIFTAIWLILGVTLVTCGVLEIVDPYWSGMGGGLLAVSVLQMVRYIRYYKNPEYREEVDTQTKDERNKFLSGRAWAWAGYLYVMLNGIAVIALKLTGYENLSVWAAYSVCVILVLYWICYLVLRKKY